MSTVIVLNGILGFKKRGAKVHSTLKRYGFLLWLGAVWLFVAAAAAKADPQREEDLRPSETTGATRVYVQIFIVDLDEIDSASQSFIANVYVAYRWRDPRPAHGSTENVTRPLKEVWNPRLQIANQQKVWSTFPEVVEIAPDGDVTYRQRVWGSFSQPLKLRDFPFDQQTFNLQLVAVGYSPEEIELVMDPEYPSGIAEELSAPDWRILGWEAAPEPFSPLPGVPDKAGYRFHFQAARYQGYFVVKVILPLVLIVAMSWVVFWIDPKQSGSQISVAITAMLTLIAYRFAVGSLLPKVSYLSRLDYFILGSTLLVFASLFEVVVTARMAQGRHLEKARTLDRWCRWLFPGAFVLLMFFSFLV